MPRSLIALIVTLAIFYNIERLNFGKADLIDIQSFVYVVGLIAVVAILAIPALRRWSVWPTLALWDGLYFLSKLTIFGDRPLFGGIHTYLFITEIVLLSATVWLAQTAARNLADFEGAVEDITFANFRRRVRTLSEGDEEIQNELARARRYHLPLSVVVIEPRTESIQVTLHRTVMEVQRAMMGRYIFVSMARALAKFLRRVDVVREQHERNRFVIVCPETDAAGSATMAERVRAASEELGVSVKWGVATFPDEALTFEELLSHAEARLQKAFGPAPVAEHLFQPTVERREHAQPIETVQNSH